MAAASAKAALKELTDRRAFIEEEMNAIIARLTAPGMPGVKGPLVDNEACTVAARRVLSHSAHSGSSQA